MHQNFHMCLVFIQKNLIQVGAQKNLKKSLIISKYHGRISKTSDPSFGDFSWNNYNDAFDLALIGKK